MDFKTIERNLTYHKPHDDHQAKLFGEISCTAGELAVVIKDNCPESRERSLAFTKLEECVMWANAAIARNEAEGAGD